MSKAAQGFLPEAYYRYVEGANPRRTPLIAKNSHLRMETILFFFPYTLHTEEPLNGFFAFE